MGLVRTHGPTGQGEQAHQLYEPQGQRFNKLHCAETEAEASCDLPKITELLSARASTAQLGLVDTRPLPCPFAG